MLLLFLTSLIWAFSFGLIKHKLGLDANISAFVRLLLSFLVFAPFLRGITIPGRMRRSLFLIGAVQHGLMYALYMNSFRFLPANLVALFTIFTPIFVTFIHDWNEQTWHPRHLGAALLAVLGTGVIVSENGLQSATILGFLLLQGSNFCFAYGQMHYREIMHAHPQYTDREVFGVVYAGAAAAAAIPGLIVTVVAVGTGSTASIIPTIQDLWVLLYLGIIPSGLCFFLWNAGARRSHPAVLAVMNNLKIPLAVAVALLVFGESANLLRLFIGGGLMVIAVAWSRRMAVRAGDGS